MEIPEKVLNSPDHDIKKTVDRYFRRFNLAAFAFSVMADDQRVFIQSKIVQRASLSYLDYDFRRRITMDLVNTDSKSIVIPDLTYSAMAKSSRLEVPQDWQSMTKKDLPEITEAFEAKQQCFMGNENVKHERQI